MKLKINGVPIDVLPTAIAMAPEPALAPIGARGHHVPKPGY